MRQGRTRQVAGFEELKKLPLTTGLVAGVLFELALLAVVVGLVVSGESVPAILLLFAAAFFLLVMIVYELRRYHRTIEDIRKLLEHDKVRTTRIEWLRKMPHDYLVFHLASKENDEELPEGLNLVYKPSFPPDGEFELYLTVPFELPFLVNQFDSELMEFEGVTDRLKAVKLVCSFSNDLNQESFEIVLKLPLKPTTRATAVQFGELLDISRDIHKLSSLRKVTLPPLKSHPRILASFQYFSFYRVCPGCEKVFRKMKYDKESMLPERCPDCDSTTIALARQMMGISIQEKLRRVKELGVEFAVGTAKQFRGKS